MRRGLRPGWPRRAGLLLAALLLLLALDRLAVTLAGRVALADLEGASRAAAGLRAAVLRAEIDKQRSLPVILAQDPDLRLALESRDPERLATLNAKLEALSAGTRSAVLYALDAGGLTLAASNWRLPDSFVGSDYAFRPYFHDALAEGAAEHFALGTVSHRPGLYLSRRVEGAAGPLGVIVVKAEFDAVEEAWSRAPEPVLATDPRGIVTVTSVADWHFRMTQPLEEAEQRAIRDSLQFGEAPLLPLGLRPAALPGLPALVRPSPVPADSHVPPGPFLAVREAVPGTGWMLTLLAPVQPALEPARLAARATAWALGGAALGLLVLALRRQRRLRDERARAQARRTALEAEVAQRTAELRAANAELRDEVEERRRAEAALMRLRDELGQANRLAVLGQITASVAHEINQPVAAIRSFADNAALLAERGDSHAARRAMGTIATLTERIGAITAGLRGFARKSTGETRPEPVRGAIEGALLLLGHRLRQHGIAVELAIAGEPLVRAERVRLEQILVNLVQNAIEALQDQPEGRIAIGAAAEGGRVRIRVADNGPGLAPAVRQALFMPFTTTKSAGLGLGLVISRQIAADLGGTLDAPETASGAMFVLELELAA
ncbi:ATP-binding protein [Pseudoroseomonas cervicalis]|uniref:ATP-binding protein n=1 Tax=Teichococcus cervicalis TaxID=204525 RepID=UPI002780EEF5|nr:ATP-binding protein [Pseudoroseomonas cervicalis]MDQ1077744.1 two-component system C4-dicarboxylate transport sensor histidine kinase DctB [Pseudoroseomonas cervicalis]